ncbi:hypothetical protein PP707_06140 [Acetobacter pasteurianus]|nr:hypothetical protein [Acetobacter pasteurianus]
MLVQVMVLVLGALGDIFPHKYYQKKNTYYLASLVTTSYYRITHSRRLS